MASRRRNRPSYDTYGSVAYAPAYDGSAVRAPGREDTLRPKPKVRPRERERTLTRTRVQVREAGEVSPFAVIGFLAVGIFAALVLWSYSVYRDQRPAGNHAQRTQRPPGGERAALRPV